MINMFKRNQNIAVKMKFRRIVEKCTQKNIPIEKTWCIDGKPNFDQFWKDTIAQLAIWYDKRIHEFNISSGCYRFDFSLTDDDQKFCIANMCINPVRQGIAASAKKRIFVDRLKKIASENKPLPTDCHFAMDKPSPTMTDNNNNNSNSNSDGDATLQNSHDCKADLSDKRVPAAAHDVDDFVFFSEMGRMADIDCISRFYEPTINFVSTVKHVACWEMAQISADDNDDGDEVCSFAPLLQMKDSNYYSRLSIDLTYHHYFPQNDECGFVYDFARSNWRLLHNIQEQKLCDAGDVDAHRAKKRIKRVRFTSAAATTKPMSEVSDGLPTNSSSDNHVRKTLRKNDMLTPSMFDLASRRRHVQLSEQMLVLIKLSDWFTVNVGARVDFYNLNMNWFYNMPKLSVRDALLCDVFGHKNARFDLHELAMKASIAFLRASPNTAINNGLIYGTYASCTQRERGYNVPGSKNDAICGFPVFLNGYCFRHFDLETHVVNNG